MTLPWDNNSWEIAAQIVAAYRSRQNRAAAEQHSGEAKFAGASGTRINAELVSAEAIWDAISDFPKDVPQLLRQTVVEFGEKTDQGRLIEVVTIGWFEIIEEFIKNPNLMYEVDWRKLEEIVGGAYDKAGYTVTLTPRSGDLGRDVIAEKKESGSGSIRLIDQVKKYAPHHLVTAEEVRATMFVVDADYASKGFVTTTSDFAPKIKTDPLITRFLPARLELINGTDLLKKLDEIAHGRASD
jgi:restriction system protein